MSKFKHATEPHVVIMVWFRGGNKALTSIGASLYSKAIEQVCGGSPIVCVLIERKAKHRGKWKQHQHRTCWDQLLVQHKCTVMGKMDGNL